LAASVCAIVGGRPVIGIEIEGNEPYWSEAPSLEEIAARCIASIREEVLKKPFHLAGFSFGAWLVYEMACQLERAGNPPRSVTIVDSCWTGTPRSWTHRLFLDLPSIIGNAPRWLAEHADLTILRRLAKRVCRQTWRLLTSGKSQGSESGDRLADALRRADPMFDLKRLPELYRRRLVLGIRAQAAYQPGNYSGRLALLGVPGAIPDSSQRARRRLGRAGPRLTGDTPHPALSPHRDGRHGSAVANSPARRHGADRRGKPYCVN